ncbi:hypothetical protein BFJ63_vAg6589 [Fusarium oxysporum f. sp. narcissi]|uniref:Uncharacterized protein n=1 Tax=Fusarium oxysporum f. sp. narcissi TaxID=451672 RepID=A0A4Q2VUK5_FUSOX|nr:hypothetical protein BFJ63_vAg6589 [Fusarium oxysporum f. sp. narcissi]
MAETQSVEMKDSTEPAHKKPEERQTRYSQEETDRLEGELSPIDALATFIRPGVVIPPYPLWRHTANQAKDMSVEKIPLCLGEHVGVIPSPPEFRDEGGDGVWQSFRTACIKQGNACRTKDSMPTPEAVLEHFERMEDRNRPRKY